MKIYFTLLLIIFFSVVSYSQEKENITLTLEFTITKYNKGDVLVAIYNSDETHMQKPYVSSRKTIKNNAVIFKVDSLPKGTYSFSYFHDVNSNKKLDKNFLGIPKEPYGFSNNQRGKLGPPSFKDSKIVCKKDTLLTISIK